MRRYASMVFVAAVAAGAALFGGTMPGSSSGAVTPMYRMTDLGLGQASGINNRGQVVGSLELNSDVFGALWERGAITDLGLPGWHVIPLAINNRGQVVGSGAAPGSSRSRAFLWEDGRLTDLGTLGGNSSAHGINDLGQVVGVSTSAAGARHAFLWEDGQLTDLGILDRSGNPNSSEAWGINNRGQVVGSSYVGTSMHAFLWENGQMTDLGWFGADYRGRPWTQAFGINDRGQVVGASTRYTAADGPDGSMRMTLWENGAITDLGPGSAHAINDRGQVVGVSATKHSPRLHAVMWENGRIIDLGTLPADVSAARGISERGDIVGTWGRRGNANLHAVLWSARARPASMPAPAPRLIHVRRGSGTLARATRRGAVATVSTSVRLDRQATVTLAVPDLRTEPLSMRTGTRLGATTLIQHVTTMRTMVGSPRTLAVKVLLAADQLRPGAAYELVLTATGTNAKRSRLRIAFLG